MTLYAVVEDYYRPSDDLREGNGYENQLLALYETKEDALRHMNDGVPSEAFYLKNIVMEDNRDGELSPVNHYESFEVHSKKLVHKEEHEEVTRRIVNVETWNPDERVLPYTHFLLDVCDSGMFDYT